MFILWPVLFILEGLAVQDYTVMFIFDCIHVKNCISPHAYVFEAIRLAQNGFQSVVRAYQGKKIPLACSRHATPLRFDGDIDQYPADVELGGEAD